MKKIADMTEGAMLKNIILFAIPVILTNILNGLYNTADIIIIGKFAGSDALAAVGNCTSVINVSFCLFLGLALGGGVLVSHGVGAGDDEGVSKTVHTSAVMSILLGIILMVIGILITPFMLKLISTPSNIFEQSKLYLQIFFAGSIPNLLYSFLAAILRALGNSKKPLYYLMISCFGVITLITACFREKYLTRDFRLIWAVTIQVVHRFWFTPTETERSRHRDLLLSAI